MVALVAQLGSVLPVSPHMIRTVMAPVLAAAQLTLVGRALRALTLRVALAETAAARLVAQAAPLVAVAQERQLPVVAVVVEAAALTESMEATVLLVQPKHSGMPHTVPVAVAVLVRLVELAVIQAMAVLAVSMAAAVAQQVTQTHPLARRVLARTASSSSSICRTRRSPRTPLTQPFLLIGTRTATR